jgi:hypothetical protein
MNLCSKNCWSNEFTCIYNTKFGFSETLKNSTACYTSKYYLPRVDTTFFANDVYKSTWYFTKKLTAYTIDQLIIE